MKTRLPQKLSAALLSLACACAVGLNTTVHAQHVPNGTNEIAFADFDLAIPSSDYGYFYSDGSIGGTYTTDRFFSDPPGLTNNVFRYTFDSTVFAGFASWWGTGFGMPLPWGSDPLVFNSMDLADYILSFDARVEGLAADQTNANCQMELRLNSSAASPTRILQKNIPYQPGSNWTHFVFTLEAGSFAENTSYTTFTNGIVLGISGIEFNQNQDAPTRFGPDADNAIYMDNIKLEVLQYAGPPPPPPPKVALPIFDYNFDDKALWFAWTAFPGGQGWSANANRASYWVVNPAVGAGVGGSQAYAMAMDNSTILTDPPGRPQWAGGNTGAGGPCDYSLLGSPDLKDYQIKFAARVEGLADFQETTPVTVQLHFRAPDDTLQPADADTDTDVLLTHNIDVSGVSSNWQTFTVSLKDGAVNAGSLANFQTHRGNISVIDFQIQIQNPHQDTVWGTDANNQIIIDDFKLERLVVGCPPLSVTPSGSNVILTWAPLSALGYAKVQRAANITGPYDDVTGATNSPVTLPATNATGFFRTKWVPPTQ